MLVLNKNSTKKILLLSVGCAFLIFNAKAYASEQIRIAGSSTVFPYAKLVADKFHEVFPKIKVPVIESGGSGAGIKEFCGSDDDNSIDIVNASRPMSESEFKSCQQNGVSQIEKIVFGYDGVVLATNKKAGNAWAVTTKDIYQALAQNIVKDGKIIANPYMKWSDVNAKFPNWEIKAFIPGEKHGTREVFEEKMLLAGCKSSGAYDQLQKLGYSGKKLHDACVAVRKDGKSVDIDADYSETLARLQADEHAVGFFGLAYYENNADKLNVATINGVVPSADTVSNATYALSRPLYFYVKKSHLQTRPGLKDYVNYFLSDAMVGDDGAVVDAGLVPAKEAQLQKQRQDFTNGVIMTKGD